ncbi:hypothetical protein [Paraburkholderia susongensis]|uniref:Uncharacterized protein n=1 Tax=Paraburkholderia susongensis TaxID=1515439 RepID=A0A1X7KXY9_9BURK|nr:hypothetical protein [Paraburkholderia susongensis]SMG45767.1 hypothetical protein SAMN06265784_104425 [Paraburkholderia susongensis]
MLDDRDASARLREIRGELAQYYEASKAALAHHASAPTEEDIATHIEGDPLCKATIEGWKSELPALLQSLRDGIDAQENANGPNYPEAGRLQTELDMAEELSDGLDFRNYGLLVDGPEGEEQEDEESVPATKPGADRSFETLSRLSITAFHTLVKDPLQKLLQGEIFSVEAEADTGSAVAKVLDQAASSDLVVRYSHAGALYTAASRIRFLKPRTGAQKKPFEPSVTLRNTVKGSYECTEINKLHRAVKLFRAGHPVIVPRYLCAARVFKDRSGAPVRLYDLLVLETVPFIEHCFDAGALDLPKLRRDFELELKALTKEQKDNPDRKGTEVNVEPKQRDWAGIREFEGNSFLFVNKTYLEQNGLPHLYQLMGQ